MPKQKDPLPLRVIRKVLPVLETVVPFAARKVVHHSFFFPVSYPIPEYELVYLNQAVIETELFEGDKINIYQWGNKDSDKKVLLVHGWAGRATQFRVIIDALLAEGFHIISYDAPGHGKSDGKTSNLPQMARIIKLLQGRFGVKTLIGHSMGGSACLFSIVKEGVVVDRLVMISSPTNADTVLNDFLARINGSDKLKGYLSNEILNEFKHPLNYYFANELLPFAQMPNTLAIHDKSDQEVGINHLQFLEKNISGIGTFTTDNLGHTKVLRDNSVLDSLLSFLSF